MRVKRTRPTDDLRDPNATVLLETLLAAWRMMNLSDRAMLLDLAKMLTREQLDRPTRFSARKSTLKSEQP